jgi:hypothetical protein
MIDKALTLICRIIDRLVFPIAAPRLIAIWALYLVPPVVFSLMQWYGPAAVGTNMRNPLLRLPEFLGSIVLYGMYREGRLDWIDANAGRKCAVIVFIGACFVSGAWLKSAVHLYWRYVIHTGALMPAEICLITLCAYTKIPARIEPLSSRRGNAALFIFAIHLPIFDAMMKAVSPIQCEAHFSACALAPRAWCKAWPHTRYTLQRPLSSPSISRTG